MGALSASEPAVVQGFAEEVRGVRSDSGFFFQTGGGTDADEETGQEQGRAQYRAPRVGGKGARALGIENSRQILKHG